MRALVCASYAVRAATRRPVLFPNPSTPRSCRISATQLIGIQFCRVSTLSFMRPLPPMLIVLTIL